MNKSEWKLVLTKVLWNKTKISDWKKMKIQKNSVWQFHNVVKLSKFSLCKRNNKWKQLKIPKKGFSKEENLKIFYFFLLELLAAGHFCFFSVCLCSYQCEKPFSSFISVSDLEFYLAWISISELSRLFSTKSQNNL